ncbi:MAG: signal recognition particle-docking protein FtsY [Deltaproteobacteria bacterium]|jgi:fused signal recognition particle receptor|nr:signal recognition particle-docking protein FtsY [Deltaproteobacteria bacterium]
MGFFTSLKNIFSASKPLDDAPDTAASPDAPGIAGAQDLPHGNPDAATSDAGIGQAANSLTTFSESDNNLLAALREASPRLSAWLDILLEGVPGAGDALKQRLALLFKALEAPDDEAEKFIRSFDKWLDNMGYSALNEFRSELQYRLALALDLEDEEDERSRLLLKLGQGLAKTRAQFGRGLNALFQSGRALDESFWEELEEVLLLGDVGYEASVELTRRLRRRAEKAGITDPAAMRELMRDELAEIFLTPKRISAINPPEILLMVGVNGAGKTTTIAKLAHRATLQGRKTLIAAGDTFRAAAVEQLEVWAKRTGADFYAKGHGADPAAVAYEATEKALKENYSLLLIDTAGRLQTKTNLMEELEKIRRVVSRLHPGAPQRCILVLDANTGQNALSQAELFKGASGVNEIILTKLDGTAKGGVAAAIALRYGLPISFIGLGEKMEDLRPFDGQAFAAALMAEE